MGVILWVRRLLLYGVAAYLATCAAVYASHRLLSESPRTTPIRVAIVLGAGSGPGGRIGYTSTWRTERAIEAVGADSTATLLFSGGVRSPQTGETVAAQMRAFAVAKGIPADRIVIEDASRTTLENIVRSLPIADRLGAAPDGGDILLVTDSTHMLRSLMLMRWHGRPNVQIAISRPFETRYRRDRIQIIAREAGAWWLNAAKVAAWSGLGLFGLSDEERLAYVR